MAGAPLGRRAVHHRVLTFPIAGSSCTATVIVFSLAVRPKRFRYFPHDLPVAVDAERAGFVFVQVWGPRGSSPSTRSIAPTAALRTSQAAAASSTPLEGLRLRPRRGAGFQAGEDICLRGLTQQLLDAVPPKLMLPRSVLVESQRDLAVL